MNTATIASDQTGSLSEAQSFVHDLCKFSVVEPGRIPQHFRNIPEGPSVAPPILIDVGAG